MKHLSQVYAKLDSYKHSYQAWGTHRGNRLRAELQLLTRSFITLAIQLPSQKVLGHYKPASNHLLRRYLDP